MTGKPQGHDDHVAIRACWITPIVEKGPVTGLFTYTTAIFPDGTDGRQSQARAQLGQQLAAQVQRAIEIGLPLQATFEGFTTRRDIDVDGKPMEWITARCLIVLVCEPRDVPIGELLHFDHLPWRSGKRPDKVRAGECLFEPAHYGWQRVE